MHKTEGGIGSEKDSGTQAWGAKIGTPIRPTQNFGRGRMRPRNAADHTHTGHASPFHAGLWNECGPQAPAGGGGRGGRHNASDRTVGTMQGGGTFIRDDLPQRGGPRICTNKDGE